MKATIESIWIYPIKSLRGVQVPEAQVNAKGGLMNDRNYAIHNENGELINAKKEPLVHSFDFDSQGGLSLTEVNELNNKLSIHFGYRVTIREYKNGLPDDLEFFGPTIVSRQSLEEVGNWFNLSYEEVLRRFRPNIIINLQEEHAFWEEKLLDGNSFSLGNIKFQNAKRCPRCPVPSRNSFTGSIDSGFQKGFVNKRAIFPKSRNELKYSHDYYLCLNTIVEMNQDGQKLKSGMELVLS